MCNPFWSRIETPSQLNISIAVKGKAHVDCSVTTSGNGGAAEERRYGQTDFPLTLPLRAGTLHRAIVNVSSLGEEAFVTVTAKVTGADARGPDVCSLEVDASHPFAFETIIAEARNA